MKRGGSQKKKTVRETGKKGKGKTIRAAAWGPEFSRKEGGGKKLKIERHEALSRRKLLKRKSAKGRVLSTNMNGMKDWLLGRGANQERTNIRTFSGKRGEKD